VHACIRLYALCRVREEHFVVDLRGVVLEGNSCWCVGCPSGPDRACALVVVMPGLHVSTLGARKLGPTLCGGHCLIHPAPPLRTLWPFACMHADSPPCYHPSFFCRDHKPRRRGHLIMRWLKEGKDGLFRPSADTWEEPASCLLGVRTQWVAGRNGGPGGYRLLTLRSRILATQLLD
jgi:hypothetical protein